MKITLLVEFEIPPRPHFPADAAGLVAATVLKVLRAQTEADCEVRVSLFPLPSLSSIRHPLSSLSKCLTGPCRTIARSSPGRLAVAKRRSARASC